MSTRAAIQASLPLGAALIVLVVLGDVWLARIPYPFDLEWMEGGMLGHAWRLAHGQSLYGPPSPDFAPFIYPPGYSAVVAALGGVFGLSPGLGRAVSVVAVLAAAGSIVFGVLRAGGARAVACAAGATFLATYPHAGAFYDLVRPDSLAVALLGWSIVIALEDRRGAPVAAGLLLAASFLVKHNTALFGLPIALGLLVRRPRDAVAFVAAAAGPALAVVGLLQWRSGGGFLTYLLEVPRHHKMIWARATVDLPREVGTALPLVFAAIGGWAVWRGATRQRSLPTWLATVVPVWSGMLMGWWGTYHPPREPLLLVPSGVGYWGLTAAAVALGVRVLGTLLDVRAGRAMLPSWREVFGVSVAATAVVGAIAMRVHDGGYTNVHMPMFLVLSLGFGVALTRWVQALPHLVTAVAVIAALQPLYGASRIDRIKLKPRAVDEEAGWEMVRAVREVSGPILSPTAAWIPVYAGREPSIHAMAVWDLNYAGGPYQDDLSSISAALRAREYTLILGGTHRFLGKLTDYYEPDHVFLEPKDDRLWPRTGWRSRPWRLLVPKESAD